MNIKEVSKTILRNLKTKIIGKSQYGHKDWFNANPDTYKIFHDQDYHMHQDFIEYFKKKMNVKSVLEVGCGTGIYPIKKSELFKDKEYVGNDFSQQCVDYCKNNSSFEFICGDFIKMNVGRKFDMVFSHAVVDHVYDPETFISKIIDSTKKYAYISSYSGYFPNLKKHKMTWRDDQGCSYNQLSIIKLKEDLLRMGLTEEEFIIRAIKGADWEVNDGIQTIIEINKKIS